MRKQKIISTIKVISFVGIIILVDATMGTMWAVVALSILIFGMPIYRLLTNWSFFKQHYMTTLRNIEGSMWGKPLDKGYWKKKERPRLFRWKKN